MLVVVTALCCVPSPLWQANPHNYDAWFDYLRLVESDAGAETVREVYERAIANVPPLQEKRHWKRYIYLWINYALYEELEAKASAGSRGFPCRTVNSCWCFMGKQELGVLWVCGTCDRIYWSNIGKFSLLCIREEKKAQLVLPQFIQKRTECAGVGIPGGPS